MSRGMQAHRLRGLHECPRALFRYEPGCGCTLEVFLHRRKEVWGIAGALFTLEGGTAGIRTCSTGWGAYPAGFTLPIPVTLCCTDRGFPEYCTFPFPVIRTDSVSRAWTLAFPDPVISTVVFPVSRRAA